MTKRDGWFAAGGVLGLGIVVWASAMKRDEPHGPQPAVLAGDLGGVGLAPGSWCADATAQSDANPDLLLDPAEAAKVRVQIEFPREDASLTVVTVMVSTEEASLESPRGHTAARARAGRTWTRM